MQICEWVLQFYYESYFGPVYNLNNMKIKGFIINDNTEIIRSVQRYTLLVYK